MKTLAKGPWLLALLFFMSCSPKGNPPKVPQLLEAGPAKNGENKDSLAASLSKPNVIPPAKNFFQEGLPSFCHVIERDEATSCIVCRPDSLELLRCFAKSANFDPGRSCSHDKDHLKCLVADNLTVIKVSFYESQEKMFLQNFPVMMQAMKTIVGHEEGVDEAEVQLFYAILDFLNGHIRQIISHQRLPELGMQLNRLVSGKTKNGAAVEKSFIEGAELLRNETLQGNLDAEDGLKFVRDIAKHVVQRPSILKMLETLSLEGLSGISQG